MRLALGVTRKTSVAEGLAAEWAQLRQWPTSVILQASVTLMELGTSTRVSLMWISAKGAISDGTCSPYPGPVDHETERNTLVVVVENGYRQSVPSGTQRWTANSEYQFDARRLVGKLLSGKKLNLSPNLQWRLMWSYLWEEHGQLVHTSLDRKP